MEEKQHEQENFAWRGHRLYGHRSGCGLFPYHDLLDEPVQCEDDRHHRTGKNVQLPARGRPVCAGKLLWLHQ